MHLENGEKLVQRTYGRYYRSDKQSDVHVPENHAFEYLSLTLPLVVYDAPRVNVRSLAMSSPEMPYEMMSPEVMQMSPQRVASSIGHALNCWGQDTEISNDLIEGAADFFYCWSVFMVLTEDQPGFHGVMVPQRPRLQRISPRHFIVDCAAKTFNVYSHNGPRWQGHLQKDDADDLLADPRYNADEVGALQADADLEKYDTDRQWSAIQPPKRGEVLSYEIWVPEVKSTDEPGYNGTIYTLGVKATPDGVSKRSRFIRDPRPAWVPPFGQYAVGGFMKLPDLLFPLSPLVAVAEQWEELNAHTISAADSAKSFKRFAYGRTDKNTADGGRLKAVKHGDLVLLDSPETMNQMEIGGVSKEQYVYIQSARERMDRMSGLSNSRRGNVDPEATATAESIADAGTQVRTDFIQRQFQMPVKFAYRIASWFMFYGEDVVMRMGEEAARDQKQHYTDRIGPEFYAAVENDVKARGLPSEPTPQFRGGVYPGQEHMSWFDLSLSIEPYTMGYVNKAMLQARFTAALTTLAQIVPIMLQSPFIGWKKLINPMFEAMNIDADDVINDAMLAAMTGMPPGGVMPGQPQQSMNALPASGVRPPAAPMLGNPAEGPANSSQRGRTSAGSKRGVPEMAGAV